MCRVVPAWAQLAQSQTEVFPSGMLEVDGVRAAARRRQHDKRPHSAQATKYAKKLKAPLSNSPPQQQGAGFMGALLKK